MNFHNRQPNIPQQIRQDLTDFVNRLHEDYKSCIKAHQKGKRHLMQRCAFLTVDLKDKDVFDDLASQPYWADQRQKPKQNGRGKWAAYTMCRPDTEESRKIAGRYGRVVDVLLEKGVAPENVASAIKELHGINAILKGRKKKAVGTGLKAIARRAKEDAHSLRDLDQDDDAKPIPGKARKTQADDFDEHDPKPRFNTSEDDNLLVQATKDQMGTASHPGKILISAIVSWDSSSKKWLIVAEDIIRD